MEIVVERVAGLDVHSESVVSCVRTPGERPGRRRQEVRTFGAVASQLAELAAWLADERVDQAVMEATGVFWKPVWYALEGAVGDLLLVNARHVKKVPGRKSAWNGRLLRAAKCVVVARSHIQLERGADHAQIAAPQRACPRCLRFQQEHLGGGSSSPRRGDPDDRGGGQRRVSSPALRERVPRSGAGTYLL